MKRPALFWTVTLIIILYGLIPYRFPSTYKATNNPNELLVVHRECTCCADLDIEKGVVEIPNKFKRFLPNKTFELTVLNHDFLPIKSIELWNGNFVINGEVVGVDSLEGKALPGDCSIRPIFKITKWAPESYTANFWSFNRVGFLTYFLVSFLLAICSIGITANYLWKQK